MHKIRNPNEVMTGIFLILVSLLAFYLAWPLSVRTEIGLGPGFVPDMFALVQLVFGVLMIISGFYTTGDEREEWKLRPLLVLASIVFFGLTIERLGMAVALTGLILIGCAAHKGTKIREAVALAVGSVVFSELIFVKLLGLSIALWPPMVTGS